MLEKASTASDSGSAEEKPCSSTAAAETSGDVMEEAKKLIGTGNRHLVMGDVVSAVHVFQEACGKLAAKYGDTADECGEALFLCGKSLLELARMENGVLGNALEGVPEESEEEEPSNPNIESAKDLDDKAREELRRQVYDAMAEEEQVEAPGSGAASEEATGHTGAESKDSEPEEALGSAGAGGDERSFQGTEEVPDVSAQGLKEESEEKEEGLEEANAERPAGGSEDEDDGDDDEENDAQDDEEEEEEEVGNLQLAWEMLELAKVIYKKESKEDQLMAAQAYLKLGEVAAETGNHPQALEDFKECLAMQLKLLPPHSRLLAETHYHVATTLCSMEEYNQAVQHYDSSIKVVESRLAMLQEVIDNSAGTEENSELEEDKGELEELKKLLPEIRERLEDAKESQRTARAASQAILQTLGARSAPTAPCENGSPSSSADFASTSQTPVQTSDGASSTRAVSDISHLVRKKRKPEEESPVKETAAKKLKQEATVNGSGDSSASNGNETQEGKSQEPASHSASLPSSSAP